MYLLVSAFTYLQWPRYVLLWPRRASGLVMYLLCILTMYSLCAYYVLTMAFSLKAGADAATVAEARTWAWAHGTKAVRLRVRKGGLIGAVVESW